MKEQMEHVVQGAGLKASVTGGAVGNGLGAPGSNTGGIRAHIDELVIIKGWAGDVSGMTSEIVL